MISQCYVPFGVCRKNSVVIGCEAFHEFLYSTGEYMCMMEQTDTADTAPNTQDTPAKSGLS